MDLCVCPGPLFGNVRPVGRTHGQPKGNKREGDIYNRKTQKYAVSSGNMENV